MIKYPNSFLGLTVLLAAGLLMAQEPRSAGFYYSRADSVARLYLEDPHLTMIRSDSVDILGRAISWEFQYTSPTTRAKIIWRADSATCDTTLEVLSGSGGIWPERSGWFDSDTAISLAEQNGGSAFRQACAGLVISCALGRDSALPFNDWTITYRSSLSPAKKFTIVINARTGEIWQSLITGIENHVFPRNCTLVQNFPNPFHSSTFIEYILAEPNEVTLTIYDITGRQIAVLEHSPQSAGLHRLEWKAGHLPAGFYLCRIQASTYVKTIKIALLP